MARHAARWPRGRRRHAAWQRLHVRPRRLWTGATVRPFARGGCDVHGLRGADRVRDAAGGPAMKIVFALISGTLFGFGLALSGMTDPAKVVGFLDITGAWDPSLGFVMGCSLLVKIGRAACRERVCQYVKISVVSVSLQTQTV